MSFKDAHINVLLLLCILICAKHSYGISNAMSGYDRAEQLAQEASNFVDLKKYEKAIDITDKALKYYKNHALSFLIRGRAYFELGDYDEALSNLYQAINIHPPFAQAYYTIGITFNRLEQYTKADSFFAIANTYYPQAVSTVGAKDQLLLDLCTWAYSRIQLGMYQEAKDLLKKAILLDSEFGYANYLMASISLRNFEYDEAINFCKIASKNGFMINVVDEMIADISKGNCNFENAKKYYFKSLQSKLSFELMLKYAEVCKKQGYVSDIKDLKKIINPLLNKKSSDLIKFGNANYFLRLLFILNYDNATILDTYEKCFYPKTSNQASLQVIKHELDSLKSTGYEKINRSDLRRLLFAKGKYVNILKNFRHVGDKIEIHAGNSFAEQMQVLEFLLYLGAYNFTIGFIDNTLAQYNISNYESADLIALKSYLAYNRYEASQDTIFLNYAEDNFKYALEKCSERIDIACNLAYLSMKKGNLSDAEKKFTQILIINPDYYPAALGLSDIFTTRAETGFLKGYLRANIYLEKALATIENNKIYYSKLDRIYYQIWYNYYKYLATYGKKDIGPNAAKAAIDGYDYLVKSLSLSKDSNLEFTLENLKSVRDEYLKNLYIRMILILALMLILLTILIRSLIVKSIFNKSNLFLATPIIPLLILIIYFWQVTSVVGVSFERKYNIDIIPIEMSGINKIETAELIKY